MVSGICWKCGKEMSESAPECPHCGIKNYALQEKNFSPEAALKLMSNPIQVVVAVIKLIG